MGASTYSESEVKKVEEQEEASKIPEPTVVEEAAEEAPTKREDS